MNTDYLETLRTHYKNAGLTSDIYLDEKPTSNLPNAYVEIYQNGAMRNNSSEMGVLSGYILIAINVKLLSTGAVNKTLRDMLFRTISLPFDKNKTLRIGTCSYSLDNSGIFYDNKGIYEGYSTRLFNLQIKIYNT